MIVAAGHQLRTPNTPDRNFDNKRTNAQRLTARLVLCITDELDEDMKASTFTRLHESVHAITETMLITKDSITNIVDLIWDTVEQFTRLDANVGRCKARLEEMLKRETK